MISYARWIQDLAPRPEGVIVRIREFLRGDGMSRTLSLGSLKVEINESKDLVIYKFTGDVDDSFRHSDVPRVKAASIVLDLEGISNFNSCGVREWVFLIRDFGEIGSLNFTKCSIAMVDQLNMVPESLGKGTVSTFHAPYVCEEHGDVEQLIDVLKEGHTLLTHQPPERNCGKCQRPLIFDAMADSYFLFLSPPKAKVSKAS
jgi:hypothetical protein